MDLRQFINDLEKINEVQVVDGADWDLEIGAITELSNERKGRALLFDKIKGYPEGFRIIVNLVSTPKRLAAAMGYPADVHSIELVRLLKDTFKNLEPVEPVYVAKGPVQENILRDEQVDLLKFPSPKWHELDGGRYLGTGSMVVMKDPKDNWVNVGTYRTQLHDRDTLGLDIVRGNHGDLIRQAYWAMGKPCPVAVVFGAHPKVWIPAFMGLPWGVEEFRISGGLLGKPLELIKCEYTGLPVPAHSEIAVEGECLPPEVETREEGPFGEWPGYYGSGAHMEAVIKVKTIMYRNAPIILGSPPLRPPSSSSGSHVMRAANIWHELEKLGIPGIKGVWNMRSGGSKLLNVISIEQKYAGHAKQVALASMSGSEGGSHGKFTIVVDDDIDPSNDEEVLWAMATRCDPDTSIEIIHNCWSSSLEPTLTREKKLKGDITSARVIILATRPYHWKKDFPVVNRASNSLREKTLKKWADVLS
ncbi:MAG: UbiD family decarboxylase [Dehalococcoidia bacterium]|nr:UbiD family decarboxylase [Dehalococcoidia bacterium]MDZ4247356.1 UbiD family decarboxylase [Dehalococcoidia bacterium]